jgi:TolB-like protein/DNA-binding winged helix-turn-helix (wHTH) protein/Tfp pilus assembly protein PilF
MTAIASTLPAEAPGERLLFDGFMLDLKRGCLLRDGHDVALRPKTFAVLCHLVENSGRLVSKDELFSAVWPNLAVTDDALVQSIGELRRALGPEGTRLITTIPRRGYRFDGAVCAAVDVAAVPDRASVAEAPIVATVRKQGLPGRPLLYAVAVIAMLASATLAWLALQADGPSPVAPPPGSSAVTAPAKPAIAVLPFVNQSEDGSRGYFADGLTQDLIGALGRFSALTVMSWNAVLSYKAKPASPGEIAHALAVRYQLEGNVRQSGDRVRVSAQLVNAEGQVLWTANFDEPLSDIFVLQDRMTAQIAAILAVRLTQIEQKRVFEKPTESLEAYDYVLRARPALRRPERAANADARALLRRAIELDPGYAAAYAGLSETFYNAVSMGWAQSPTAFFERAQELADKALSLNDNEVRAHVVLGRIRIFYQRYEQAKAALDRAIEINPNAPQALAGRGNVLMWMGETEAAIQSLELAQQIDPDLHAFDQFALSLAYYLTGRYAAAVAQGERILRRAEGAHFAYAVMAAAHAQLGRNEDAAQTAALLRRKDPTFDSHGFGSKFLNPADLDRLRDGLRKASLYPQG